MEGWVIYSASWHFSSDGGALFLCEGQGGEGQGEEDGEGLHFGVGWGVFGTSDGDATMLMLRGR